MGSASRARTPSSKEHLPFSDPDGLLRFDAFMDVIDNMIEPDEGWRVLVSAIGAGKYDHLLNAGSPVPVHGRNVPTLLWCCAAFAPLDVVDALLVRGADPQVWCGAPPTSAEKILPLSVAASRGRADVVKRLIKAGADPNDDRPLIGAVQAGSLEAVEALLAAGASVNFSLEDGTSLLQLAQQQSDNFELVSLIRKKLAEARHGELRNGTLRFRGTPAPLGGLSAFVRPRLVHDAKPGWLLLACTDDMDRVASRLPGSARMASATTTIASRTGIFLIRFLEQRWTWVLLSLGHQSSLPPSTNSVLELCGRLSPTGPAVIFEGLVAHRRSGNAFESVDLRDRRRTRNAREGTLKRVDDFATGAGLALPNMYDESDGAELGLSIVDCSADAVERAVAVVPY